MRKTFYPLVRGEIAVKMEISFFFIACHLHLHLALKSFSLLMIKYIAPNKNSAAVFFFSMTSGGHQA